jgi:glycine/D-amino acid oxidase-like deaminating enzyme
LNKKGGTINPLDYCQGLARAAHSQGASIYESTLATKIQSSNNHWIIETSKGSIKAKMLLIATNAYQQPIAGIKSSEYTSVQYFQVATDPLPEKISKMILPNGEGCWDTASVMSSFRLDESNRFIIGGVGNLDHIASKIHTKWAKRKMESLFPMLKNIPIKYSWHGRIAMTNSHIPKIVKLGNNAYSIYGYSGRGIGPGTYFGKAVAECLLNNNEDYLPVSPVNDNQELFRSIKSKAFELGATARHLL